MPSLASGLACIGPSTFTSIALILSIFANSRCNLVKLTDAFPGDLAIEPTALGLWCFEDSFGNSWDARSYDGDNKFEAARGLGTSVLVFGWIMLIFYLFASCKPFPPLWFRVIGLFGVINCLLQGLVFLVYKSKVCANGCSLDTGGRCAVAAIVFWFIAGLTSCGVGKVPEDSSGGADDKEDDAPEQAEPEP